jgi:hypothetical protein
MPAPISVSIGPPNEAWITVNGYSGTPGNLLYTGQARASQPNPVTLTIASVSAANPAELTSTAHGLANDSPVTISGATGDWAALNGTRAVTVTAADTFTVAVDSSGFSGSFDGVVTTTAPRTNAAVWSIQKFTYDGSNQLTRSAWADGTPSPTKAWDSRTTYAY